MDYCLCHKVDINLTEYTMMVKSNVLAYETSARLLLHVKLGKHFQIFCDSSRKKLYKARGNWLETQVFAILAYPLVPKFEYHKA